MSIGKQCITSSTQDMHLSSPELWDVVVVEAVEHGLQSFRHDDLTLQCFQQVLQGRVDHF